METLHFEARDSFRIGDKLVFTGPCPIDCAEVRGHDLLERSVEICGEFFIVKGVETWAIHYKPKVGEPIGLMVTPK